MTDGKGNFSIPKVADGKYFVYVEPSDKEHLPGGSLSNKSMTAGELAKAPLKIAVSGKSPDNATFVGSSKCMTCHSDYESIKKTAHKLGISVVGKPSKLQDVSRFPGLNDGLNKLMAGTTLYFYGFDKKRGFDKYQISEKAPADPATVNFTATFFKDADNTLKFRTKNTKDSADADRTYTVEMTYGGAVYKQRYLYRVGDALFPFVQFNSNGKDEYNDRTRKPWRDYHGDWLYNAEANKLTDPPKAKSFERSAPPVITPATPLRPRFQVVSSPARSTTRTAKRISMATAFRTNSISAAKSATARAPSTRSPPWRRRHPPSSARPSSPRSAPR